jgi:hypothetical protein
LKRQTNHIKINGNMKMKISITYFKKHLKKTMTIVAQNGREKSNT